MRTSNKALALGLLMMMAAPAMAADKAANKLSATLPEGWKSAEFAQGMVMVPGDARTGADGPEEAYIMLVTPVAENVSLKDPKVLKSTLAQLSKTFDGYEPAGKPKVCDV